MKIRQVTPNDESTLLDLMCESHTQEQNASPQEWEKTEAAITALINDPQAGEAYFLLGENGKPVLPQVRIPYAEIGAMMGNEEVSSSRG